jgi:hypothetical protein
MHSNRQSAITSHESSSEQAALQGGFVAHRRAERAATLAIWALDLPPAYRRASPRLLNFSASDPLPQPTSKPRVFVQEANDSWSFTASRHFGLGSTHPQTVEVMKTFSESCPDVLSRMTLKKQIIELNSSVNRAS